MFVQLGDHSVVHTDEINWVDIRKVEDLVLVVYYGDNQEAIVSGIFAIDLLMTIKPSVLEGKRMRWHRHRWAVHNLIGHPLMQILSWLHKPKLAMSVHDRTIPRPSGRKYAKTSSSTHSE